MTGITEGSRAEIGKMAPILPPADSKEYDLKGLKAEAILSCGHAHTTGTLHPAPPLDFHATLVEVSAPGVEVLAPGKPTLPSAVSMLKLPESGESPKYKNALRMAEALDGYVAKIYQPQVKCAVDDALQKASKGRPSLSADEKLAIAKKSETAVHKKFNDSLRYFVAVDVNKDPEAPLVRMSAPFEHLKKPVDPAALENFNYGMHSYAQELARRAFDQHMDNPEQYVSHGFDHSINVANYTREVLKLNPEIAAAAMLKYGISEGEALFMLETVALLHDCGYPCVGCKAKSVHGISGADIVVSMLPMFEKMITSETAKKEMLFNDFRNSIMFHSADKVEEKFTTKLISTQGTFLADHKNVIKVLSNFYDPAKNPSGQPRYVTEIFVQDAHMKVEMEQLLKEAHEDLVRKLENAPPLPKVTMQKGLFEGRFADLEEKKDKLLGLEFSRTDLLSSPLTMIRLVDNMDMRKTRFTPTQNESAFRQIYLKLGDGQDISKFAVVLEEFEKQIDIRTAALTGDLKGQSKGLIALATQRLMHTFIGKMPVEQDEKLGAIRPNALIQKMWSRMTPERVTSVNTPKEARDLFTGALIESILFDPEYRDLPIEVQEEVQRIGMLQSSVDLRHFGGCEAVLDVQLRGIRSETGTNIPMVVVTVDSKLFHELNTIRVTEASTNLKGQTQSVVVGVGEYQIWRASDAYRSILLGGRQVQLRIIDTHGHKVESSIDVNH